MGGSSILAATVLRSILALFRNSLVDDIGLISLVGYVEQLLTTGGGWQDQVGLSLA
jgi:hypothetical protein